MKKNLFLLVLIVAVISGCQKKGDPGPAGASGTTGATGSDGYDKYVNGSFTGTITGKKKDGSTLNESFSYTYSEGAEGYTTGSPATIQLYRSQVYAGTDFFRINLSATNKGQVDQQISVEQNPYLYFNYFSFSKQISTTELFSLTAPLNLHNYSITYPIDPANASYPFSFTYSLYSDGNWGLNSIQLYENNTSYMGFKTKAGETVYFISVGAMESNEGTFYKIVDASGNSSLTSSTYGKLKLTYSTKGQGLGFTDETAMDLSKVVDLTGDKYTITNYLYNATEGTLSFDFTFNFNGAPYANSTTYPLTISGKFTGKVYDKITG